MMGSRTAFRILFKLAILSAFVGTTNAGNANEVDRQQTVARGVAFLLTAGQADDGSFSKSSGPAITAICVTALLRNGASPEQPAVRRALKYLQGFIRKDGGIYQLDSLYQNYETCLAIMCMAEANDDGRYSKQIERATAFVKQLQWDETEDIDDANYAFGGGGYGKHWGDKKEVFIRLAGYDHFLKHQLQNICYRLQQPSGTYPIRADPDVHISNNFPFCERVVRDRNNEWPNDKTDLKSEL
jgi:hypothetical protein